MWRFLCVTANVGINYAYLENSIDFFSWELWINNWWNKKKVSLTVLYLPHQKWTKRLGKNSPSVARELFSRFCLTKSNTQRWNINTFKFFVPGSPAAASIFLLRCKLREAGRNSEWHLSCYFCYFVTSQHKAKWVKTRVIVSSVSR